MAVNKAAFFGMVRHALFGGTLSTKQVDGMEAIIDRWEQIGDGDSRKLAYLLATTKLETGSTMQPIRERGNGDGPDADKWDDYLEQYDTGPKAQRLGNTPAADGDGVLYAGRGFVMITGKANYAKAGGKLGIDLVGNPDWALRPGVAANILISGCMEGWFTGKKLGDYIEGARCDYVNARRVVNGTDRAEEIADDAEKFEAALQQAPIPADKPAKPLGPVVTKPTPSQEPASPDPAADPGGNISFVGILIFLAIIGIAAVFFFANPWS